MHFFSLINPLANRLEVVSALALLCALTAGPHAAKAGPTTGALLDPDSFTSLGANPFTSAGTYTIDPSVSNSAPILTLPNSTTINGVFSSGVAVFTFDNIFIPTNVTVVSLQDAGSDPVALLSQSNLTIAGVVEVSGAVGSDFGGANGLVESGGNGGAAGPGGGGGGGGGGTDLIEINLSIAGPTSPGGSVGETVSVAGSGGFGGPGFVSGNNGGGASPGEFGSSGNGGGGGAVGAGGAGSGGGSYSSGGGGAFGGDGGNGDGHGAVTGIGGTLYGDLASQLQGGSGGAGGGGIVEPSPDPLPGGAGGGGGGGAVEIGALDEMTISGTVLANGGDGGSAISGGGGGAGGGILIQANRINLLGSGSFSAAGGVGNRGGGGGGGGRISIFSDTTIVFEGSDVTTYVELAGGAASNEGTPGSNGVLVTSGTLCPTVRVVINDNDNGPGSLRQAILDAGGCPGTNTIIFAPSAYGTITLTSGELAVSSDLNICGPGATNVAVNGNYPNTTNRVFDISSNLVVTIAGLTITNGNANDGAGIYNDHSTLTVSNCNVTGNSAGGGGGAGIYNAAFSGSATLTVIASTLSSNITTEGGGGILNNAASGNGTLAIINSTFNGNQAYFVGAIWNDGEQSGHATLTILDSTFNGDSASLNVGGIFNDAANSGHATLTIGSTILNAAHLGNIMNQSGTVTSEGYNLSNDNGGGYLAGPADQTNTNPKLGPLQDNGGPTPTCALLCGSPAIDQGTNFSGSATDQRGLPRTVITPSITKPPGGDGTDIGAFEVQFNCYPQPVAVCSSVTVSAGPSCTATASVDGGSYDPNPTNSITLVQSPPGPYELGSNTVTLTVFDQYNNTNSCEATVLVLDTTLPVPLVSPLPGITNQCSATLTAPQAFDNCAGTITASTTDPTSYHSQGSFLVHWVYNDGNGNIATQVQSVVIKDTIPPTITCPSNITSNTAPDQCGATVTWAAPEAMDNCAVSNVVCAPPSGSFFNQGTTKVTCTATDIGGNTASCTFNVAVNQPTGCSITVSGDSNGSTTICQGQTLVLTAANGMKSYLWSGPEQNGATAQSIVVGVGGTYYCTQTQYYGSTNCCSVTITVNPPPNATITGNLIITNGLPTTLVGPAGMAGEYWTGPQNNGLASQSNTVIDPGIYTLHVTDTNGCQNTGSVTVLNRTPAPCSITASGDGVTVTGSGPTICGGYTVILTGANGMSSYLWNGPGVTNAASKFIRVGNQGTYTVQQIDGNGLTNTCSTFLTVHPMPSVNIFGTRTICQGTSTTLSGPPGMSQYLWLGPQNNGFDGPSNTVSIAGTYTLQVTDSNGCQNSVSAPVTVVTCP